MLKPQAEEDWASARVCAFSKGARTWQTARMYSQSCTSWAVRSEKSNRFMLQATHLFRPFLFAAPFVHDVKITMNFRMDGTLSFWVYCSYQNHQHKKASHTRAEMIVEILRDYERTGDAMRYVNAKGQIAWKASPWLISRLADAEREVRQDMEEFS